MTKDERQETADLANKIVNVAISGDNDNHTIIMATLTALFSIFTKMMESGLVKHQAEAIDLLEEHLLRIIHRVRADAGIVRGETKDGVH